MNHDPHDQPTTDPENRRATVRERTEDTITRTAILLETPYWQQGVPAEEQQASAEIDLVRADGNRTYLARLKMTLYINGDMSVRVQDTAGRWLVLRTIETSHEVTVDLVYAKE